MAVVSTWAIGPFRHQTARIAEPQRVTPAPAGPFHTVDARIIDSQGRPFLIRGTDLAPFSLNRIDYNNRADLDYGAHSATTFSAIRLRFNLNTVRLPLDLGESAAPRYFEELAKVVRRANDVDLLVILAANQNLEGAEASWVRCAEHFKDGSSGYLVGEWA